MHPPVFAKSQKPPVTRVGGRRENEPASSYIVVQESREAKEAASQELTHRLLRGRMRSRFRLLSRHHDDDPDQSTTANE